MLCHGRKCSKHKTQDKLCKDTLAEVQKMIFLSSLIVYLLLLDRLLEKKKEVVFFDSMWRQVQAVTVAGCCSIRQKDRWR